MREQNMQHILLFQSYYANCGLEFFIFSSPQAVHNDWTLIHAW